MRGVEGSRATFILDLGQEGVRCTRYDLLTPVSFGITRYQDHRLVAFGRQAHPTNAIVSGRPGFIGRTPYRLIHRAVKPVECCVDIVTAKRAGCRIPDSQLVISDSGRGADIEPIGETDIHLSARYTRGYIDCLQRRQARLLVKNAHLEIRRRIAGDKQAPIMANLNIRWGKAVEGLGTE